jgi:DNA-directed RNA polymerase subunit beta
MLSFTARKRLRNQFGKIKDDAIELPNLIEIQKNSYDKFLGEGTSPELSGLYNVFSSVFPIKDFNDSATLEFVASRFGIPKYDVEESRQRGINFAAPLYVTLRMIVWVVDEDAGTREIKDIKEQDVYMGDVPMMTKNGTFVINGTERVIVSQMHRSPGVFFDHDKGKTHSSGKFLYNCRIIPYRGSWLDFEFDGKDLLFFRIDRRRKLYASSLLRALGMDTQEILETFYDKVICVKGKKGWTIPFDAERMKGVKLDVDLIDPKTGKAKLEAGTKITAKTVRDLKAEGFNEQLVQADELAGRYAAEDIVNGDTGEIFVEAGDELTESTIEELVANGLKEIPTLNIDNIKVGSYLRDTIAADKAQSREDALIDVYKVMRPGEPPTVEAAEILFENLFFVADRYDLSDVGRMKMNARLDVVAEETKTTLTKEDIIESIRTLISIKDGFDDVDDIDHLGNRRIRSVGELMENQFRVGLLRMERAVAEKMSAEDIDTKMPQDLINSKPLAATIKEFFGGSQLSQFMDQTNPLSEITHKRRLSALGPGGLTRERAGFEVRDVHLTHYGRICPIETPEGPNIGLINSLATYAKINKYGFIDTPYRKVVDSKVTDDVEYLSAIEEGKYTIAQATAPQDKAGKFTEALVSARRKGEFTLAQPEDIDYIDVSPKQLVSVAASLIPFLENDDANRALMGSNMQRQAVPLLRAEAPFVGTGMEAVVAKDSGVTVIAKNDGIVDQVDATRIVVRTKTSKKNATPAVDIYTLQKYQRSNQDTCINQKPLVRVGDEVKAGDIIGDGTSTDMGELALGRNVLCAFMPWNGYNFEDSILISERIVTDDVYTSIHIEEFEVVARDTKLGPEDITRDIPNVGEESLRHLDEVGVVHVGAEVNPGDIMVGKVTPKSESPVTPEEKLLRAIFGEKAADVRDSSLRLPPGVAGTIVDVRVYSRRGVEKDERALQIEREQIERLRKDREDERSIIDRFTFGHMEEILVGQAAIGGPKGFKAGTKIDVDLLQSTPKSKWFDFVIDDQKVMTELEGLQKLHTERSSALEERFATKVDKVQAGDDLPTGVLKVVKVFVAVKRKLQPGDKMAGRHGNKGVISRIVPIEDMPYLEDGTPADIVLNPLGVPSRMNIGQIMEIHLGWAAAGLGKQIGEVYDAYKAGNAKEDDLRKEISSNYYREEQRAEVEKLKGAELEELARNLRRGVPMATPAFDGAKEEDIDACLIKAGISTSGQVVLHDGLTGEPFDRKVTVGYVYMLKLHHLVDDKIHARSIGPYSLVTQQPLGGKSHFGGQRFGEMECWALQAYGAAHTLQEILTVKSDDVIGRTKVYESIVRGDQTFEPGIPESFNVIVKELRGLGLNVELEETLEDEVANETSNDSGKEKEAA